MDCDYCVPTDIVVWERKGRKGTPVYWCERQNKFCKDIKECPFKPESEEESKEENR